MPVTQIRAFHRPDRIQQAWHLLEEGPQVRLVGGGTDLAIHCPGEVRVLVDLAHLGIDRIEHRPDGFTSIGAMTTLSELLEHPVSESHASGVLAEMLVHVGSPLLRNAATVGGHLARGRLSDVIPVLVALDAEVELFSGRWQRMSLEDYYSTSEHEQPHILTSLELPPVSETSAAAFLRFSRSAFDHAIVAVACRVDAGPDGTAEDVRVVVGTGGGVARRVEAAEDALRGRPFGVEAISAAAASSSEVETRGSWIASAEYRRHLAGVLVERCLHAILSRLEDRG